MIVVDDDLLEPSLIRDPVPYYSRVRTERPVHYNERWRGWMISRYDDVYAGLHDPRYLADTITPYFQTRLSQEERDRFAPIYEVLNAWVVFLDPPKHTYLRRIFARAFTPRAVARMRGVVEALVREALDEWAGQDRIDLVGAYAYWLPANVIATIIGAPREDLERFHHWADVLTNLLHGGVGTEMRMDNAQQGILEFKEYLQRLYDERIAAPRDDMMSWLMEVQRNDPGLRPDDVLYSCMLLLNAGHETTQNLIANSITTLLDHPEQYARLRDDPSLVKTAIEECLRMNGPMKGTMRVAATDLDVDGNRIAAGERILLWMAAANRDPARFPDPERFDIARSPNPHLAFGHGIHFCLGAPLARLELELTLLELPRRYPKLRLEGEVRYQPRILSRSIEPPVTLALSA